MFAELHCHTDMGSNTRLTDTTNKVDATIRHAVSMGLRGLAITDHEALCAHIKALNTIKKIKAKQEDLDFTLILGNEIYLCHDTPPIQMDNGKIKYAIESPEFYHFILLAKDKEGHRQLRELSSRAWERAYTYKRVERVPTFYSDLEEIVKPNPGHLIASTACLGGEFDKLILADNVDGSIAFVNWCRSIFGEENFYIELQPGLSEDQIKYNTWAVKFCKWYGLPWIITNDVHYLTADKRVLHENFLLSHEEEREVGEFYESTYFKSEDEMIARMRDYLSLEDILSGFENTIKIVDVCKNAGDYGLFHSTIIPQRKLPSFEIGDGFAPFYDQCPSLAYCSTSPYEQDRFCLAECERGAREKRIPFTLELAKRIDIELQQVLAISEQLGQRMTSYYNLVQFIVQKAWQVSLVGNGRGSACGFMLCYLMDITQVDSVKWNLPWWRHAHATKIELADIDEDFSPSKRPLIFQMMRDEFGENRCLNIITFKHETSKAAIQTAARGLGIDVKVAREISALVPITRGKVWSIQECLNGNKEEGWAPVPGFADKINSYHPLLLDTVLEIEGLVSGRGVHASGFYIFNSDYVNQNSLMKAPNGTRITCWEMHDSDEAGALKVDLLVTDAVQKIQLCLGLLANDGYIQDQGSLKATYDKYLHPDVLDYETKEMWEMAQQGKIVDLFQFDSAVGSEAIRKSLPYNLKELALANSVMRLMANEDMNPLDHYCALKKDISLWYKEMRDNGLNEDEIKVLEKYLLTNYGCSIEQEDMLELVMDPHISDFTMPEVNKLKKGVSKKIKELVSSCKELYLKKGKEIHTSSAMLNYVWKYLIQPQLGYAFSRCHTLPYSTTALQEMNLAYHYPIVYWQTACLTINASADDSSDEGGTTNYGKTATAISNMQNQGTEVALPEINTADFGFRPDAQNSRIIFGLKALCGVGDDDVNQIIANRPYTSLLDFCNRVSLQKTTMISLIKAGSFDELEKIPRHEIMRKYILWRAKKDNPNKEAINMRNIKSILALGLIPKELDFLGRVTEYRSYIKKFQDKDNYKLTEAIAQIFFENELLDSLKEGEHYRYTENQEILLNVKAFEKWYKSAIAPLNEWLKQPATLDLYNKAVIANYANTLWDKYCQGTLSHWEMETLSFYHGPHELAHVNVQEYGISNWNDIPSSPEVIEITENESKKGGSKAEKYKLYRVCGTVLDKNKNKHSITLLTTDGVITVKYYSQSFAAYDKSIPYEEPDGTKGTDESWFSRGNLLLLTGIRRDDTFFPKTYYDSIYRFHTSLIREVSPTGMLVLENERMKAQ